MCLKLHYSEVSPSVRSTLLTINALGIEKEVELITVDLFAEDHLKPEFLKKNPLHTIPTLEDGDLILYDSHAINAYLADKYGKDDSLYPKDLQKRAIVNQRLHINSGVLYNKVDGLLRPVLRAGAKSFAKDTVDAMVEAYDSLEVVISNNKYVAGDQLTIADFHVGSTISTANAVVPVASNRYPKIAEWLGRMQALQYYKKANQDGLDELAQIVKSKLSS